MPTVKTAKRSTVTGHDMLSRYVTNKPRQLKSKICKAMNAGGVVWRHPDYPNRDSPEICIFKGMDFLSNGKVKTAWQEKWQGSCMPPVLWDAIGRVQIGGKCWSWMIVSAFSHPDELSVKPTKRQSNLSPVMAKFIDDTKATFKVDPNVIWPATSSYVQQLATFAFLIKQGSCAQQLNVYMVNPDGGPTKQDWQQAIDTANQTLGITADTTVRRHMHQLFLPVI